MTELEELRREVGELREWKGAHEAKLGAIETQLEANTLAVQNLVAVLNKGRGAIWAFGIVSLAIGSIVTALIEWARH